MTRLREEDIAGIEARLVRHDAELRRQTGAGLRDIALCAASAPRRFARQLQGRPVAVLPVTTGQGIIGGFSESVRGILAFLGMDAFVTQRPDVAGLVEAVESGAGQVFLADDDTCTMLDFTSHATVENSAATGRGFAAALALAAGDLRGRTVTVLGAGIVGRSAAAYLRDCGADLVLYDTDETRTAPFSHRPHFAVARSLREALDASNLYFEATTARGTIDVSDMDEETLVAAPGIPLGVTDAALARYDAHIIHDPLELGVAAMACELQVAAAGVLFDENKKIG